MTTIGLIADTHVPDRKRELDPRILPIFKKARVGMILHAGDISVPRVLDELAQAAPVIAVRGNRDWLRFTDLPLSRVLEIDGLKIGMTHGHINWGSYARDKMRFVLRGPQTFEFFANRAVQNMPNVDILIFGHNHEPMIKEIKGTLVVNPGSACCQVLKCKPPSIGLLHIEGGKAKAEIIYLE